FFFFFFQAEDGIRDFHVTGVQTCALPISENVRFLRIDESFVICAKNHPIECGLHGHLGPNGSRGTTANLSRMGARINKGHDHAATIRNGVYSAGVCALEQGYNQGPTSWSVSHICTYLNGKRCILTERVGRLWA